MLRYKYFGNRANPRRNAEGRSESTFGATPKEISLLRAEWERAQGRPISFHATSGDVIPWRALQAEKPLRKRLDDLRRFGD